MSEQGWVAPGSIPQGSPSPTGMPPSPDRRPAPVPGATYPPAPGVAPPPPAPAAAYPPAYPSTSGGAPGKPGGWPIWQRIVEHRPGIIPLRPLTLSDLYGGVTKMIRGNPAATLGLAFVVSLAFLVPTTVFAAWLSGQFSFDAYADPANDPALLGSALGSFATVIPSLATQLATVLLAGFMAWITGQAVLGRKVTPSQTWEGTRPHLLRIIGATFLVGFAVALAVVALVALPLVWLAVGQPSGSEEALAITLLLVTGVLAVVLVLFLATRLTFVNPVIVLESARIGTALRRSWALSGGRPFWRILGIRLLTSLVVGLATGILTVPLTMVAMVVLLGTGDVGQVLVWQAIMNGVTGLITATLTTPVTAGVDALLYVDQRIRREGLDVQLLEQLPAADPLRQA